YLAGANAVRQRAAGRRAGGGHDEAGLRALHASLAAFPAVQAALAAVWAAEQACLADPGPEAQGLLADAAGALDAAVARTREPASGQGRVGPARPLKQKGLWIAPQAS